MNANMCYEINGGGRKEVDWVEKLSPCMAAVNRSGMVAFSAQTEVSNPQREKSELF